MASQSFLVLVLLLGEAPPKRVGGPQLPQPTPDTALSKQPAQRYGGYRAGCSPGGQESSW